MGVRVSQVKPSNCFRLHPTSTISKHSTIPIPDSLQAPRKNEFYLPLLTQDFQRWWCETCRVIRQQFWTKESDILGRGKNNLTPPTYFQGVKTRNPPVSTLTLLSTLRKKYISGSGHFPCIIVRRYATVRSKTVKRYQTKKAYPWQMYTFLTYLLTWSMLSWGGGLRICIE